MQRRSASRFAGHRFAGPLVILGLGLLAGCGGPPSQLHILGTPKGAGPVDFQIENRTDATINRVHMVPSEKVRAAPPESFEAGSPEAAQLWGDDRLGQSALGPGGRVVIPVDRPGSYDVRVVDRDERWQHISNLKLAAGGRYILELHPRWQGPP